ncbi:TetR/AcrR family transcriptional regulator [Streptomyces cadmiisoli]|uniref:TetR/AcrR family transcriptional regulator n=1 Tax=Streptomyces cadmiisoli TaxID=2184053 RepID=UPI0013A6BAE5|nr:TetR/AcrR family transcriptional regulator [Streptomyces cadmiisoli]
MPRSVTGKPPTRRQLAAEQTRRKLLRAALEEFSERPYGEVTVGNIARSAGVAHGLLSHHFKGKENLYAEVVLEVDRQLRAAARIPLDGPVADRLRRHLTAHLEFLAAHREAALNLVLRRAEAMDLAEEAFATTRRDGISALCGLLGLDVDEPALELPMRGFTSACDEMTRHWLRTGPPFETGPLVECCVTFLAGALRAAHDLAPSPALHRALEELLAGKPHQVSPPA